jgi:hypothetical protein
MAGSGAAASAGTHDRGGVIDFRTWDLGQHGLTIRGVLETLRRVGFAAWHRTTAQGFDGDHIHAVAIGDEELAPLAAVQVRDYRAGHNGLADHGPDDGPRVPIHTWEQVKRTLAAKKAPVPPGPVAVQKPPTVKELLDMKLTDTLTIPGNYLQNPSDKPQEVTVEVLLRRIAEWSYVAAYGNKKAKG